MIDLKTDKLINFLPLVSVLMTAYNREKYIAEAIESVLASDYPNFELVIVDDGSTDKTVMLANQYMKSDSRIRLYINKKNLGDYQNRNRAAGYAKGKYLMYCDSDDQFFKDSISYCVSAMEKYPGSGIGLYYALKDGEPFVMDKMELVRKHFFEKPVLTIGPGGTIIRRSFFELVNGYPIKYGPANDMYFNLKVCCETEIVLLPKLFLHYRIHEGQEKNNIYDYIHYNCRYLTDALSELDLGLNGKEIRFLEKKNNRRFSVNLINHFIHDRNLSSARRLWSKADFNIKRMITGIIHF